MDGNCKYIKQTADKVWSSSFRFGLEAKNSSPQKPSMLQNVTQGLGLGFVGKTRQRKMDMRFKTDHGDMEWVWTGFVWLRVWIIGMPL
jgi:hypothetical protein